MVNRISGLSSGIDYDTIIKKMMDAQRVPLNKLNKQKQLLEWKRDDYRTLNNKILEFKNAAFDMTLQGKYLAKKVNSSNENAVSVTGSANASNGQYSIEVEALAEAASFKSGKLVNINTVPPKPLLSKDTLSALGVTGQAEFTIGGEKGTATILMKPTDSIESFMANINSKSASTGVKASYDSTLQTMFFVSSQTGENSNITLRMSNIADNPDTADVDETMDINKLFFGSSAASVTKEGLRIKSPGEKQFFSNDDKIDSTLVGEKSFKFDYDGKSYNYSITSSTTIGQLMDKINTDLLKVDTSNKKSGVEASLTSTGRIQLTSYDSAKPVDYTNTDEDVKEMLGMNGVRFDSGSTAIDKNIKGTEKFKINYGDKTYSYDINSSTNMNQLINNINMDLGKKGVSAFLSSDGKLSFVTPETSPVQTLNFADTADAVLKKVSLDKQPFTSATVQYSELTTTGTDTAGKDAKVKFNGVEGIYSSNTFTIAGMNITVKQETTAKVNIGVTQDVDSAFDSIKKFVDKYNELIELVNNEMGEKRYRDFEPLTDAEKEDMSDKEIERWEEKARSGTLANDQVLTSGLMSFRRAFSDSITGLSNGQFNSLSAIGISNSNISGSSISGSYDDKGKLYIDEAKLKAALGEDPEGVMALFTTNAADSSGDGVATRLYDKASVLFSQITERAGVTNALEDKYAIGKETKRINEQITAWTKRLEDMETRYYKQFSRMESYIDKMNSQSAYLTQQFSTGG